jgi:putative hemolysin
MIPVELALIVVACCLAAEFFFSGSEIAMVAADRVILRRKAAAGSAGARRALDYLDHPERLISVMLFGHNLAIVTAATVTTLVFIGRPGGEAAAVAVLTPVSLVLAETMPKMLFQANADAFVPRIVYGLRLAELVFKPIIFVIERATVAVARLLRVEAGHTMQITRDELRILVDEDTDAAQQTTLPADKREMIKSVLDFGAVTVYEVMVPLSEVTLLAEDATIAEAAAEIVRKQHTRIPIYRDRSDQIVGLLMAHDVLAAETAGRQGTVTDLAKPAIYVPEAQLAADLLVALQEARQHLAVVVDEYGGAIGICSVEDILEEIVGEIDDEYDREQATFRAEGPGIWRAQGRTKLVEINKALGLDLPEGDYESVAGLILERLQRIPREGEQLRIGQVTLTVLSTSDRAIEEVRIRLARAQTKSERDEKEKAEKG